MIHNDVVRRSLDRIAQAFELQERGGTSLFALSVVVRGQADGLRAIRADVAEPLAGLADNIEAASKDPRPAPIVRDLMKRFEAWRKDTVAVLDAESRPAAAPTAKARAAITEEERRVAREALLAEARALSPGPAPADVKPAAKADPAVRPVAAPQPAPPAKPDADDSPELSMEEIQRLLDGAKK